MYADMSVVCSPCFLQDLLRASYAAGGAGGQAAAVVGLGGGMRGACAALYFASCIGGISFNHV